MAFVSSKDEADVRAQMGRELRRSSQKTVFDARQRLTSSTGTRASFDFELLDEYAGSRLSGVLAVPVLLIILGLFSSLWVPPVAAALWVALAIAANSAVIFICRRFKRTATREKFNAPRWTASFIAAETAYGICWSLLSLFSLVAGGHRQQRRLDPYPALRHPGQHAAAGADRVVQPDLHGRAAELFAGGGDHRGGDLLCLSRPPVARLRT